VKNENGGQRFDDDILRCKEEILRLKNVVPPFGRPPKRASSTPAALRQKSEPAIEIAPLSVAETARPLIERPSEPIETAAENIQQTAVQTIVEETAPQPTIQEAEFLEPEPELEPELEAEPAPESKFESQPLVEDSGILAALEAEAAKTAPAPTPEPEPKLEPEPLSVSETEPEFEFESVPVPAPEPKLELDSIPVPDSELEPESESDESEIPEFNLAEQIMAAQRKLVGNRRKGPGSARFEIKEIEQQTHPTAANIQPSVEAVISPPPKAAPIRIVAMEAPMSPQQKVIADIVARDINKFYQTRKVS
jgi:hypothetical protein